MADTPITFELTVRLDPLAQVLLSGLSAANLHQLFPHTVARVRDLATQGETLWREKATTIPGQEGRPLRLGTGPGSPMVPLNRSAYASSILAGPVMPIGDGIQVTIHTSDPQAEWIEEGTPGGAMDLHDVLPHAPKARRGRQEPHHLYLRIPFRHATTAPGGPRGQRFQQPGARPGAGVLSSGVIRVMAHKRKYLMTGTYEEPSIHDPSQMVTRYRYTHNPGRLTEDEIVGIQQRSRKHLMSETQTRQLVGLMRVGREGHGGYLTIRTLSQANPEGWRIPPYPAQHLAKKTKEALQQLVDEGWFQDAMEADAMMMWRSVHGPS